MAKKVNKVIFGNEVIMDVTDATATAEDILEGKTAYGADGTKLTGTLKDPSAVTVGQYTHATGHGSASSAISVRQNCKVVSVQGAVTNLGALSKNTDNVIGKISGVDLPPVPIRTLCRVGAYAYSNNAAVYYMTIATNGNVTVNPIDDKPSGLCFTCSVTYVA